jgi:hypothetical protein
LEYYFLTFCNLSTKGNEIKTFPLERAIFGRCPRPPSFLSRATITGPRRKKGAATSYIGGFVGAADD